MIPTVIIINDNNPELEEFAKHFESLTRVLKRTSIQGEQLYGIFEGIIYCDSDGKYIFKRQDNYADLPAQIENNLSRLSELQALQLKTFLERREPSE